jgi:hypothetical protein
LHGVPLWVFVWVQPLEGLHPSVVHGLPSSQTVSTSIGLPVHTWFRQWSSSVQGVPSLHGIPSGGAVPVTQVQLSGWPTSGLQVTVPSHPSPPPGHLNGWRQVPAPSHRSFVQQLLSFSHAVAAGA